ncbi:DUF4142 domain-containing protein [Streptomyces sp. 549]|uniref:DUF4142 domain-containing protein n=1 Tax=Streptomyces sp. 549 TaxID=3049076 RepID=UPI0024C35B76|nr:DUF4142 domain-containing protein [Streptomyces sp. 549]MDK1473315.1 DUF4142 domain-containing protein [Streptomyces sp. 549]
MVNGKAVASGRAVGTALVVTALAATLAALLLPVHLFPGANPVAAGSVNFDDDGRGTVATEYGPLTPLDRDFVRKVRLAGLWELPAGRQAQERSSRETVIEAGKHLIEGHTELDERSIEAGRALGIELANQPNAQQQGWLAEMNAAQGDDFDRVFANLLRAAHGKVFGLVAQVRAETRNSMVRSLATRANAVVLDHITVLEETGLVDFEALSSDGGASRPVQPSTATPGVLSTSRPPSTPGEPSDEGDTSAPSGAN